MENEFQAIQIERPKVMRTQIREAVRELIVTGKLAPGEKIPSVRALARLWAANVRTVHVALSALEKEGLLVQRHGKGTFVRKREAKLQCVGIYCREDFWTEPLAAFPRAIYAAIKEELGQAGVETRVWIDPRPATEHAKPWPDLCQAAARREIQGLITVRITDDILEWQNRLPIPFAFMGAANCSNVVNYDMEQLARLSLQALARQGCRSVGLICPIPAAVTRPRESHQPFVEFYERLTDLVSDLGLAMRNQWVRIPRSLGVMSSTSQEKFGYDEFRQLWSQRERPDGLIVFPDTTARGVILGLREKQVRVPAELKLVLHKNESIELLCPMPATFVVTNERAAARALIKLVQKQFRGEPCTPIQLGCKLLP